MKTSSLTCLLAITASIASAQPPRHDRRPMMIPPVFAALDTDRDRILSADEIENAADSLASLDKNGDGQITLEEFHRPLPQQKKPQENDRPPVPPVIAALDTDRDGFITADEIQDASESLKKLDKNNDGSLSPEEIHPHRPPHGHRPDGPPPEEE